MGIQNLAENIIFVTVIKEQQISKEISTINEFVINKGNCHVIIDFSRVEWINSSDINNLIILHNLLCRDGYQLILCDVAVPTKCIFAVIGFDKFFTFADNKRMALEIIKNTGQPTNIPTNLNLDIKQSKSGKLPS